MKKPIILSLLICTILMGACSNDEETITITRQVDISAAKDTLKIEDEQSGSYFTLGTLELTIEGNNDAALVLNAQLKDMQQEYINEKKAIDISLFEQDATLKLIHELIYEVAYADDNIVSIIAKGYDDSRDAAHPNVYRLGYVFSSQTGTKLSIVDILGSNYQNEVQKSIIEDISDVGEIDGFYPGIAELLPAILVEENWYIQDNLIYFIFNPYQIAPGVFGVLEFTYPYKSSALSDI